MRETSKYPSSKIIRPIQLANLILRVGKLRALNSKALPSIAGNDRDVGSHNWNILEKLSTNVGEIEVCDPCINGTISRRQQLLCANEILFATALADTAFDVLRFDGVRFGRRAKKTFDRSIKKKGLPSAISKIKIPMFWARRDEAKIELPSVGKHDSFKSESSE